MAAIPPFFGNAPNGQNRGLAGPEELRRRQAIARELLASGGDVRGVDSGIEAFGKVFQTGVGVLAQNRVDQQMKQGQQMRQNAVLNSIPGNGRGSLW